MQRANPRAALRLPADRVHAWRMHQQLLAGSGGTARLGADPVDVASTLVGVQAQVLSSAALAIALRRRGTAAGPATTDETTQALAERRLVRSWAMRGTLHLFSADDVPTIAAALAYGRRDMWRRPAWLRWFGLTEPEMERLLATIGEILDDGSPRTRAELSVEIGRRLGERAGKVLLGSWGSALKIASDERYLVQSAGEGTGVRFVRASRWIADWREEDPHAALAAVVERYLAAYGPATQKELVRWWGVTLVALMRPVIESLGERLTHVEVDGVRALVRTVDVPAIEGTRPMHGTVTLVGGFDAFMVGAGLREQLIPPAHLQRVSRTAGWISPVVLIDGVAAGVWDARRSARGLAITIDPFDGPPSASLRRAIAAAAERVGAAMAQPVTTAFGRVFVERKRAQPFNDR